MTFGEMLRTHRRAAGLTQEELAERAGISPRSISGLERGDGSMPRRDTVALLARALGLSGGDRAVFEATVHREPRLRSLPRRAPESPRHNIPRSLTSFVGRDQEVRELGQVLAGAPLVTLVGPGGIGKTRLAQELARVHVDGFADGASIVELAELADPSEVAGAVAAAVGLRDVNLLTEYFRSKQILLVLDNCEHLIKACAELVARLLRACPRLQVLATSREPLAIDGEVVWLVQPLELPDPRRWASVAELAQLAAVRLFIERARAVDRSFALTEDNAAAVVRVCAAVDGIPLGLELAAARTRLLAVDELVDRLEHDGHLLGSTSRIAAARHRTIRATVDWSYALLREQEQILLRRLAVFASGWTLELAEAASAGAGINRAEILDVLARLVDKSMVVMTACDGVARYRLLERLAAAGEAADFEAA